MKKFCANCKKELKVHDVTKYKGLTVCFNCSNSLNKGDSNLELNPFLDKDDELQCPQCGSRAIITNQKGFSAKKALGFGILTGGVGLLAGFHGKSDQIYTCQKCGFSKKIRF